MTQWILTQQKKSKTMKTLKHITTILTLLCFTICLAQQTPASNQVKDFAIVGATAHIGNGTVIDDSMIIVSNGKIT